MLRLLLVIGLMLFASIARAEEVTVLDVTIAERKIVGGVETLRVAEGANVELRWSADEAVELHLHGYEIAIQVPAGGTASMVFAAVATGRFPISHHGFGDTMGQEHSHGPILYLEVYPK